jgi:hypothetical protein
MSRLRSRSSGRGRVGRSDEIQRNCALARERIASANVRRPSVGDRPLLSLASPPMRPDRAPLSDRRRRMGESRGGGWPLIFKDERNGTAPRWRWFQSGLITAYHGHLPVTESSARSRPHRGRRAMLDYRVYLMAATAVSIMPSP